MTKQHIASNQQVTEGRSTYNVIAVSFDDDRNAETAMTLLKELDAQEWIVIQQAVVVMRRNDGQVIETDSTESTLMLGTASGGIIGLLIGIIGGPLGMLIGGAGGLYAGALFDIHDAGEAESALAGISSSVRVGRTALLAVVTEQSPEPIDTAMSGLGGTVLRRSVADVDAEVAAAEKAERIATLEARKELIRGRQQHDKAAVSAKLAQLKNEHPHGERPSGGETSVTPSDEMKHHADAAWEDYDTHLTKVEDHLEAAARKAETSFEEHTAVPEARLERTEDHLEAAARNAEAHAAEQGAQVRERTHMSTHGNPTREQYLEADKRVAAAEYELAAELAETDEALDTAVKKGKSQAKAAPAQLKQKAARSRKQGR